VRRFVLDCSVSAAWCLRDESNQVADRYLALLADGEAIVPSLWVVEMFNVLVMAERRRRISATDAELALSLLDQLPIVVAETSMTSMVRIREQAVDHRLSAYDAAYLDLALQRKLPLATLDRTLRHAAKASGVEWM